MTDVFPVLIDGQWRRADGSKTFSAWNPATESMHPERYPVSSWSDCEAALEAAAVAFDEMQNLPRAILRDFLEHYASAIEDQAELLAKTAESETGLPFSPRLRDVELPRTTGQLRQAAAAAVDLAWALPTIDRTANIRSLLAPIGPVVAIGPNNFPFAFNGASGGDFAAAIAAGNPVIIKGHPSHPTTTRLLAELAQQSALAVGLPRGAIQLIYRVSRDDGWRLVADPRVGAVGFTGSRSAGLAIKQACDQVGKPVYLEMSSVNPVIILPGAIAERGEEIAREFCTSCLMGAGQFCTNPGLVLLVDGPSTGTLIEQIAAQFHAAPAGVLLSKSGLESLASHVADVVAGGARVVVGGKAAAGPGWRFQNTLLRITGQQFLEQPELFQTEMFGAASLVVVARSAAELESVVRQLEGNLTGTIYSARDGGDDGLYGSLAPALERRVGRLINDKMPTGVAVSPAMNHGGPFPSTGHPGFTSVGIPASLRRFAKLQCYDQVRPERLPAVLRDESVGLASARIVDGQWTPAEPQTV